MSRKGRIAVAVASVLASILAVLAATLWYLTATQSGTRQLLRLVSPLLPAGLETGEVSGRLVGPLQIRGLRFESPGVIVTVDNAEVDWRPARLMAGELALANLSAQGIDIVLRPQPAPPKTPGPWQVPDIELPLDIAVDHARVRALTVRREDATEALLVVDEATIAGAFDDRGARLKDLSVSGPALTLSGAARLDPKGEWPLAMDATLDYRPDGMAPVSVQATATGNLDSIDLAVAAQPPWDMAVRGTLTDAAGEPGFDLTADWEALDIAAANPDWPAVRSSGLWRITGDRQGATVDGQSTLVLADQPTLDLTARVALTPADIRIEAMTARAGGATVTAAGEAVLQTDGPAIALNGTWTRLQWPLEGADPLLNSPAGRFSVDGGPGRYRLELTGEADPGELSAGGYIDITGPSPSFELAGQWRDLATRPGGQPSVASRSGTFTLAGTAAAYTFGADSHVVAPPWVDGPITVAGRGDAGGLALERLEAPVAGGRLTGGGSVAWRDGLSLEAAVSVSAIETGRLWAPVPGQVSAEAKVTGATGPDGLRLEVTLDPVSGTLMDAKLAGSGRAIVTPGSVAIERLALSLADARVEMSGRVGADSDLTWRIDAPDLARVADGFAGMLKTEGRYTGGTDRFVLDARLDASKVAVGPLKLERAEGVLRAARGAQRDLEIRIDARGLEYNDRNIATLLLETDGRVGEHIGEMALTSDYGELSAKFTGGYRDGAWNGSIDALRATPAVSETTWVLNRAAALGVARGSVVLENACLLQSYASLCADIQWLPDGRREGAVRLGTLALADFSPWLPPGLAYDGALSGELTVSGQDGAMAGKGYLALSPGAVRQLDAPDDSDPTLLAWQQASLTAQLADGVLAASGGFRLTSDGQMDLQARLPMRGLVPDRSAPVSASLNARLTGMPLLEALIPDLARLRGEASVDLEVSGTLQTPRVVGSGRVIDASAELPRLGISLTDTQLSVRADGASVSLTGGARSGDGEVDITGDFALSEGRWRGSGALTGERFTAVSLPELSAILSPDVRVEIDDRDIRLQGAVVVPEARIEPRDLSGTVQASPDAVVVGADSGASAAEAWQVTSTVRISLGEDVRIEAFGLEGGIEGSIVARDEPGRPSTASGELSVTDATYTAYSQELTVERGRLIFTGGPIANPGVDIRATRSIDEVVVGVDLRGQLGQPEATLFSRPTLSQAETLSYLVLGRPLSSVGEGDQDLINQASVRLGLSGAGFLAQEVGRRIGLDEVAIRNGDNQAETALVVGKYLSPRLYVSYGLGLFEAFNTVLVRYKITPNLAVQTEAGSEQSADLFYTLER